jgi:hypothetical protein
MDWKIKINPGLTQSQDACRTIGGGHHIVIAASRSLQGRPAQPR